MGGKGQLPTGQVTFVFTDIEGSTALLTRLGAGPRDDQWNKVKQAMDKGLPKTAIEQLEPIIAGAIKDRAYPEAIKAIARKIALEGNIQGNKPEEKVVRLKAEIARAPAEMVPVMFPAVRLVIAEPSSAE